MYFSQRLNKARRRAEKRTTARRRPNRRLVPNRRLSLEPLEARAMMSAAGIGLGGQLAAFDPPPSPDTIACRSTTVFAQHQKTVDSPTIVPMESPKSLPSRGSEAIALSPAAGKDASHSLRRGGKYERNPRIGTPLDPESYDAVFAALGGNANITSAAKTAAERLPYAGPDFVATFRHASSVAMYSNESRLQDQSATLEARNATTNDNFFDGLAVDFDSDVNDNMDRPLPVFGLPIADSKDSADAAARQGATAGDADAGISREGVETVGPADRRQTDADVKPIGLTKLPISPQAAGDAGNGATAGDAPFDSFDSFPVSDDQQNGDKSRGGAGDHKVPASGAGDKPSPADRSAEGVATPEKRGDEKGDRHEKADQDERMSNKSRKKAKEPLDRFHAEAAAWSSLWKSEPPTDPAVRKILKQWAAENRNQEETPIREADELDEYNRIMYFPGSWSLYRWFNESFPNAAAWVEKNTPIGFFNEHSGLRQSYANYRNARSAPPPPLPNPRVPASHLRDPAVATPPQPTPRDKYARFRRP